MQLSNKKSVRYDMHSFGRKIVIIFDCFHTHKVSVTQVKTRQSHPLVSRKPDFVRNENSGHSTKLWSLTTNPNYYYIILKITQRRSCASPTAANKNITVKEHFKKREVSKNPRDPMVQNLLRKIESLKKPEKFPKTWNFETIFADVEGLFPSFSTT